MNATIKLPTIMTKRKYYNKFQQYTLNSLFNLPINKGLIVKKLLIKPFVFFGLLPVINKSLIPSNLHAFIVFL